MISSCKKLAEVFISPTLLNAKDIQDRVGWNSWVRNCICSMERVAEVSRQTLTFIYCHGQRIMVLYLYMPCMLSGFDAQAQGQIHLHVYLTTQVILYTYIMSMNLRTGRQ
jgi:hypothetical protein